MRRFDLYRVGEAEVTYETPEEADYEAKRLAALPDYPHGVCIYQRCIGVDGVALWDQLHCELPPPPVVATSDAPVETAP